MALRHLMAVFGCGHWAELAALQFGPTCHEGTTLAPCLEALVSLLGVWHGAVSELSPL